LIGAECPEFAELRVTHFGEYQPPPSAADELNVVLWFSAFATLNAGFDKQPKRQNRSRKTCTTVRLVTSHDLKELGKIVVECICFSAYMDKADVAVATHSNSCVAGFVFHPWPRQASVSFQSPLSPQHSQGPTAVAVPIYKPCLVPAG